MPKYRYLRNEQFYVTMKWTRRGKPCALMALVDNGMAQMNDGELALASIAARKVLRERAKFSYVKKKLEFVNGAWRRVKGRRE